MDTSLKNFVTRLKRHIEGEDILKALYKLEKAEPEPPPENISKDAGRLAIDETASLFGDLIKKAI